MISASLAIEFIAYALMMAGLGFIGRLYTPVMPQAMLIVGVGGAGLGLLWAILIFRGIRCRSWAISSLVIASIAGIWLAANVWMVPGSNESEGRVPVILAGLMTFFSIGQLILLMQDKSQ